MRSSSLRQWGVALSVVLIATAWVACKDPDPAPTETPPEDVPVEKENPADGICTTAMPGPRYSRRLTRAEYARSLEVLTGTKPPPMEQLPDDNVVEEFSFNNHASALRVSAVHVEKYAEVAARVADDVLSSSERRKRVVGCDLSQGASCLESFIRQFGRRAYRRQLTEEEVASLMALGRTGADDTENASLVLQAMLQSPHFLYRVEVGAPDPQRPGVMRLTGYEMATRLAFTFLGEPPDDALLTLAEKGELDTAEGVARTARTLLTQSPQRARESLRGFYMQWLSLQKLDSVDRPAAAYPAWRPELRDAMREEAQRVMDEFIWNRRDLLGVLTADHTWVNGTLADFYGLSGVSGSNWKSVKDPSGRRGGLFTLAGLLTVMANTESVAPILRGKFVRQGLLCTPPPPVPDAVPELPEAVEGESERDRLARHRDQAACMGCHQMMDPVGFGLEQYDAIGAYRTHDSGGHLLTGAGSVYGLEPPDFTGPVELGQRLRDAPETSACAVRQVFRWTTGRYEREFDRCSLEIFVELFRKSGHDLPELLVSFAASDTFRYVDPSLVLNEEEP